jgi:hypothetical protein
MVAPEVEGGIGGVNLCVVPFDDRPCHARQISFCKSMVKGPARFDESRRQECPHGHELARHEGIRGPERHVSERRDCCTSRSA